ncbi:tyrosine recombinase XerC [Azospira sp. I13]|uniref:tyrosine recombinase XerC n=1 Tax=Azospira sp. I13 TaxID=1765050 RepID=UPI000D4D8E76|nr:tyrosine recombinase XerC [Azospira sp. I13]GBG03358.1 tyrosine recombinase XerC [Azospira sp. I13]
MDDQAAVGAFLAEVETQRRQSPHTVSNYRRDIGKLLALAAELPGQPGLGQLQAHHIRRFVGLLHGRSLAGRSLARSLSAWRVFYRWLGRHGLAEANPCEGVRPPKGPRALPHTLSPDEAVRLLESSIDPDDPQEIRDRAMFELFYSSGLRLAELADLDLQAVSDIDGGEVRVHGKRDKERVVPVGGKAREALAAWLLCRVQLARQEETALFVGARGRRISHGVIQQRLARRAQLAGLPSHVHPHMLRHSFASHVLQSSGDLRAVQEMLGHASIASTQVYTHLDFQHLAKVYDTAHPRAKRK